VIPFHIATPQGCNIQTFYGLTSSISDANNVYRNYQSWNKPVGVSHVYMMLIGGGGEGQGGTPPPPNSGGASGVVTVWYGAAQHVPNSLLVRAPAEADADFGDTTVSIWTDDIYDLLTARSGSTTPMSANSFTASGFFQSVGGAPASTGDATPSATTFLSSGSDTAVATANYGYTGGAGSNGYFIMQPIIVGLGGRLNAPDGGIGCGSHRTSGKAGQGMVLIASW